MLIITFPKFKDTVLHSLNSHRLFGLKVYALKMCFALITYGKSAEF